MDPVNSVWFVTRRGRCRRRPITQYSWRSTYIQPTYILTYGVLMGFQVSNEGAVKNAASHACLPTLAAAWPAQTCHTNFQSISIQTFQSSGPTAGSRWLKSLYCDWLTFKNSKIPYGLIKKEIVWIISRLSLRFQSSDAFHKSDLLEGFSQGGTRVPKSLWNVEIIPYKFVSGLIRSNYFPVNNLGFLWRRV